MDRGALQNEGLGTCRPRMYLEASQERRHGPARQRVVRSCRLPLHVCFCQPGRFAGPCLVLNQNQIDIQTPVFALPKQIRLRARSFGARNGMELFLAGNYSIIYTGLESILAWKSRERLTERRLSE